MEGNIEISEIMKYLSPLSIGSKLEIISRLTKELKSVIPKEEENKNQLLDELYGSWKDMDDGVIEEIISSRTI